MKFIDSTKFYTPLGSNFSIVTMIILPAYINVQSMDWLEEGYSASENVLSHGILVNSFFIMFPCLCILILHFLKKQ